MDERKHNVISPDLAGLVAEAEARALLAAATPGPWQRYRPSECPKDWRIARVDSGPHPYVCRLVPAHVQPHAPAVEDGDAALIAAAPRLLSALCDEVTALRERAERAEREVRVLKIERPDSEYDELERLAQERLERLAAVEHELAFAREVEILDLTRERDAAIARAERAESREDGWRSSAHTGDEQVLTMRRERDAALARLAPLERVAEAARAVAADDLSSLPPALRTRLWSALDATPAEPRRG